MPRAKRSSLMAEAERLDREAADRLHAERQAADAADGGRKYELIDAPNGQRLPRWVVGAMLGPLAQKGASNV